MYMFLSLVSHLFSAYISPLSWALNDSSFTNITVTDTAVTAISALAATVVLLVLRLLKLVLLVSASDSAKCYSPTLR